MSTSLTEVLADSGGSGDGDPTAELTSGIAARSPMQLFWRRLRRDKVTFAALIFVVLLILIAIFAPLVVKALGLPKPNAQGDGPGFFTDNGPFGGTPKGPNWSHPMGVDTLGEDVMSRVIYGARVSLEAAILSTAIAVVLGTIVGMIAGYYRGWVDTVLSRTLDVMLGFPSLLLGIGLASACSFGKGCVGGLVKPGLTVVVVVIALAGFPYIARIIRGQVLSLREREFVEAARSLGASDMRIIFREILPNLVAPLIVYSTLVIPQNILFEASLSFLGVGVQPPTASWGQMIGDAVGNFQEVWWYMLFPGLAILLTVLAFNLIGDGVQDALDPKGDR